MGGSGSGRFYRCVKALVVEDYLKIDVRYLAQKGLLKPYSSGTLMWSNTNKIAFKP